MHNDQRYFGGQHGAWKSLIAVVFTATYTASAQTAPTDSLVTPDKAISLAINNGVVMRIAANHYQASMLKREAARQELLPTAQAALSANRHWSLSSSESSLSATARVNAGYELSLSRFAAYRAQRGECAADGLDLQQQRDDAATEVLNRFIDVVVAENLIGVELENVDYQERNLVEISALTEQGVKARSDLFQQRSVVAEAQSRLLQARLGYDRSRYALLDILGLRISGNYRFDTTAILTLSTGLFGDTLRQWRTLVRERGEIAAARYRLGAAEAALQGKRLAYIPSISASGSWAADRQRMSDGAAVSGWADPSNALSAGASVGIPVFDQRHRRLQVREAATTVQSAQLELERTERAIDLEIMQAALDDTMAQQQVEVAVMKCAAAREALDAMEERYRSGASAINELNAVGSVYTDAVYMLVKARFNCISGRVNLLHAIGRSDLVIALIRQEPDEKR